MDTYKLFLGCAALGFQKNIFFKRKSMAPAVDSYTQLVLNFDFGVPNETQQRLSLNVYPGSRFQAFILPVKSP